MKVLLLGIMGASIIAAVFVTVVLGNWLA